jgi:hypothetical protein
MFADRIYPKDLKVNHHSSVGCVSAEQNASPSILKSILKMMRCPPGQHILGWIGMIFYREIPKDDAKMIELY